MVGAEGKNGPVQMLFSIVKKKNLAEMLTIINQHNPNAFYTIEEVQTVNEGYFKVNKNRNPLLGGIFNQGQVRK